MLEGLLADWQKPERPDEMNTRYGVTNQQVFDARMGTLGSVGAILLAAGQRMRPEQRAQLLAQLANAPQQFQQNIQQQMQNRLLGAKMAALDEETQRKAQFKQLMSDPEAFKRTYGVDPSALSGLDWDTAQGVLKDLAVRKVMPKVSYQDLGNVIGVFDEAGNQLGNLPKGIKGQYVQGADGNYVMLPEYGGAPRPVVNADGTLFVGKRDTSGLSIDKDRMGNVVIIDKANPGSTKAVMGPDGQPMKAPADTSSLELRATAGGGFYVIDKANPTGSRAVTGPDGQPLAAPADAGSRPTVEELRVGGLYSQALEGYQDMVDALRMDPKAAEVNTAADLLEGRGSLADMAAKASRSTANQMFMNGMNRASNAFLRFATGAGMSNEEANRELEMYRPKTGEDAETKLRKLQALRSRIEDLRLAAGRAIPRDAAPIPDLPANAVPNAVGAGGGNVVDFGSLK